MIKIISCSENEEGKCDSIETIDMKSSSVIWIDSQNPSPDERIKISKALDIDMDEIMDSLDEEEHARVEADEDYISIIYSVPYLEGGEIETASFGIFIKGNIVLTLHLSNVRALENFERSFTKAKNGLRKKFTENRYFFIYSMLETINRDFLKVLNDIDDKLEELNNSIFSNPGENHIQEIIKHKKTLIYFNRALLANRDVLMLIKRGYLPDMEQEDVDNFIDLYSDTLQLIDMASTFKELSNTTMNLYHSSLSSLMNQNMKKLTILAVIFVVPTLISGIYGMNFEWMPLLSDPYGFFYSLIIMIVLIGLLVLYVRWNDL